MYQKYFQNTNVLFNALRINDYNRFTCVSTWSHMFGQAYRMWVQMPIELLMWMALKSPRCLACVDTRSDVSTKAYRNVNVNPLKVATMCPSPLKRLHSQWIQLKYGQIFKFCVQLIVMVKMSVHVKRDLTVFVAVR